MALRDKVTEAMPQVSQEKCMAATIPSIIKITETTFFVLWGIKPIMLINKAAAVSYYLN